VGRAAEARPTGKVWLVGAGPGDPELLTLKALRVIENADLILFDQLVSDSIKNFFPKSTSVFYVGKSKGNHSLSQAELNQLIVKKAKQGLNVVRLKGGDPFVFGRGGEELVTLLDAGVEAEIVPGITAASGCAASTYMPLTHRGISQGCTFVTGHGEKDVNVNWPALVALEHTLVFYMGISTASSIQAELLNAGMAGSTPLAIIENGCRSDQRTFNASVEELSSLVEKNKIKSPAIIVVGEVVAFAQECQFKAWADKNASALEHELLRANRCA